MPAPPVLRPPSGAAPDVLAEAQRLCGARGRLLDAVDAAVVAVDLDGHVTSWNRGAARLHGFDDRAALGRHGASLLVADMRAPEALEAAAALRADGRWEGRLRLRRCDGSCFTGYVRTSTLHDDGGLRVGFVGVCTDITDQVQAQQEIRAARDYMRAVADSMGDGLCTLDRDGRIVFMNPRAEQLLGWTATQVIGLDVHEVLHHTHADGSEYDAADCPLVQARRSGDGARIDDDSLVRSDGTLLPVRQVMTPFDTDDGAGGFVLVFSDMTERRRTQREAERSVIAMAGLQRIRDALVHDRFVLHAQPIVEVATGAVVQHELLIRMLGEDGTLSAPATFLPLAEEYGLIGEIDRWVIRQALALAADGHPVELNLSAHSLCDRTLYDYVDAQLRRTGADPALVVFELTETALMRDEDTARQFAEAVRARGCGLALDDFGTGYGGFSYLKNLPIDLLKIDVEFVRDLVTEPASRQVVEAVVSLARGFGIATVAEGVEDEATLELLAQLGVDFAQGYGIARPKPLDETIYQTGAQQR